MEREKREIKKAAQRKGGGDGPLTLYTGDLAPCTSELLLALAGSDVSVVCGDAAGVSVGRHV